MSTSDQDRPLTRREMRELGLVGPAPVPAEEPAAVERPQDPVEVAPEVVEMALDPDAVPLTRRQAREIERIRTASVPVVEPEEPEAAPEEEPPAKGEKRGRLRSLFAPKTAADAEEEPPAEEPAAAAAPAETATDAEAADGAEAQAEAPVAEESGEAVVDAPPVSETETETEVPEVPATESVQPAEEPDAGREETAEDSAEPAADTPAPVSIDELDELIGSASAAGERLEVSPDFGRTLLVEEAAEPDLPDSFDELIGSTDGKGSSHTASALILTQAPEASLAGPVTATGEILVTGSFELPEGLATHGRAHGTADGADIDAMLLDSELPAASSPTPIAASAAVGTIKPAGEVIRPPAPEKGSRLMLALAITAGALAVAVAAALIIAFAQGVF